ncbi:translation initiation factor IF-3 [candidate division KSB1 bacterium]|nr:translation initiation factor IF-3 [candidate division KSB1 bacterium]
MWRNFKIKKKAIRVNEQIRVPKVRVIGSDGAQVGILGIQKANELAEEQGLDLVEVSPNSDPPVCKIMDFGKYKYELSKKEKLVRKKQHVIQVKEIRLRPSIEDHDFDFKLKNARKFLEQGNKVKFNVMFRGREMAHQEFGKQLLNRIMEELDDIAKAENKPKLEGRNMVLFLIKK